MSIVDRDVRDPPREGDCAIAGSTRRARRVQDFCDKRGVRPHNRRTSRRRETRSQLHCYAHFNAGLQCYDIRDPKTRIVAYFIRRKAASSTSGTATTAPLTTCSSNGIEKYLDRNRYGLYALEAPDSAAITVPMR